MTERLKYAQGAVSLEFKTLLRNRIEAVSSGEDMEQLLNDFHDAALTCKNDPDGLRAAVKMLEQA
jgi:hypothetical protein